VNNHNTGIVHINVFHELPVYPPQKLGFGELFLVYNWWDDFSSRNIHKHTMTQFISLLEEDELSLQDNALCHTSNEIMFLLGDFLVTILLPRPPDVTTLDFHFTRIARVKVILNMKFQT
jgi:hypothetical protein